MNVGIKPEPQVNIRKRVRIENISIRPKVLKYQINQLSINSKEHRKSLCAASYTGKATNN